MSTAADPIDLTRSDDVDLDEDQEEFLGSGHDGVETDGDYELSPNIARDLIKYVRSATVKNEQQFLLFTLAYLTGYMDDPDHYVSGVLIGTSSSGKTHVQKQIESLFLDDHLYEATTGTDKALIYDGDWEEADIVSMDELNKPSDTIIEFLKSAHGDDEGFEYKTTEGSVKDGFEAKTIERTAKPYFFLYAQHGDRDFELSNRLLSVPVHESKTKNKAVGALAFDYNRVSLGNSDVAYDYEFAEGTKSLRSHIQRIKNNTPGRVFLPNGQGPFDWSVWDIVSPIFAHGRSESNRIYDMVANLIRASALLNYPYRDTEYVKLPNEGTRKVLMAEPQDVANVLMCREALLATTHELDRKRRGICEAIDAASGYDNKATIDDIRDQIQDSNMSELKRGELEGNLEVLRQNYLVQLEEGGRGEQDKWIFNGFDSVGFANVYENEEIFAGNHDDIPKSMDPISGESFLEAYEAVRDAIDTDAKQIMSTAVDEISQTKTSEDGEATLGNYGGSNRTVDLDDHVAVIHESVYDALDGKRVPDLSDVPVEALIGLTDPLDPERGIDTENTLLDPDNVVWTQSYRTADWVETERKARQEIKSAIETLLAERIIIHDEVHERADDGEPIDVTFSILSPSDIS